MEQTNQFQAGDEVRCIDSKNSYCLHNNGVYTIQDVKERLSDCFMRFPIVRINGLWYRSSRFILAKPNLNTNNSSDNKNLSQKLTFEQRFVQAIKEIVENLLDSEGISDFEDLCDEDIRPLRDLAWSLGYNIASETITKVNVTKI